MGGRVVQGEEVATAGCAAGEVAANPYLLSTNPLMLATGERLCQAKRFNDNDEDDKYRLGPGGIQCRLTVDSKLERRWRIADLPV